MGWDSSVGIATCYGLDVLGIKSQWGQDILHPSRSVLGPTQPPIQWVPSLSQGVKRPGRGVDHPSQSSAKVKERVGLHLYSPFGPSWSVLGRNLLGLRPRTSCIEKFKKLQILTAPCLCILEKMFGIKNPDKYQTNVSIQSKDTRQKIQLHLQSLRLSSIQKNVCYSSIRIFNKLPPHIVQLRENTMAFKNTLKKFLKNAVYSINDFLLGDF